MFRDGIFDSFGDFLDSVKKTAGDLNENDYALPEEDRCPKCGGELIPDAELAEQSCPECGFSREMKESKLEEKTCPKCGGRMSQGAPHSGDPSQTQWECHNCGKVVVESQVDEDTRKEAEQTMQPEEENPKSDAEKLGMEDWSEEDKDGAPKRKDDVEYPSELREPEDKEFDQEVTYERRKDPLYLCNECFKTFRADKPICKCGSETVERIVKEDEYPGSAGIPASYGSDLEDMIISAYENAREEGKSREEATQIAAKASKGQADAVAVRRLLGMRNIDTAELPENPKESKISEDSDVGHYKYVFLVQYNINGTAEEDRVEAFDSEDAKRMVLKKKPDAEITGAKKIGESKIEEENYNVWYNDPACPAMGMQKMMKVFSAVDETDAAKQARALLDKEAPGNEFNISRVRLASESKVNEGLEKHTEEVLDAAGIDRSKWDWGACPGESCLEVEFSDDALQIMNALAKSGEFGPTYYENHRIRFMPMKGVFGESKVNETVQELVGEVPGINRHHQEILNWAIENEWISNEWPSYDQMIDQLSQEEASDFGMTDVDPDGLDLGELKASYLKYVLLPQAKGLNTPKESKVEEQEENGYKTVAKGIEDKATAEEVARKNDGQVIADEDDPNKFAVISKKEQ